MKNTYVQIADAIRKLIEEEASHDRELWNEETGELINQHEWNVVLDDLERAAQTC